MTPEVDPRLARRRRQVQEASARRRLRWTISLLGLAVVVGLVVAVFQSSWLAINNITVEGAQQSPVATILKESGLEDGVPIISVRSGDVEERLRADPWIAEAQVRVVWPRSIEVAVVEYVPVAHVAMGSTWLVCSSQGAVLAVGQNLVEPLVRIEASTLTPGEVIEDPLVLGALEFIGALPIELKEDLVVDSVNGELVGTVAGHEVILGSTREMSQKAVTLAVLLEQEMDADASINLVSPLRPAVTNPQPEVEGFQEVTSETTASS
ncbi:MAG: FtsQ-type POTRA domain-containing protein [Acidimicrobiia bacterium]|nr:FtsQ-type POTRA domain-containing protein [Acidimicrobiia bacterium]MDX2467003.1 FtsQ-type POTRA domain-containing protein [Acidimicrobiia bacterium]